MRTVDVTPTWQDLADTLVILITTATNPEARQTGRDELRRALVLADAYTHALANVEHEDDAEVRRAMRHALTVAHEAASENARHGDTPWQRARRLLRER